ncbi:prohibitin family protein [Enterovirga rhinocerotis]|uniref:Regulator of protease activity HflC (Stomatin/prohibitin superfamily) n=1 Tax=Enterovirga rhinocerotis TaxID=1339210 RepID=A0A4R7BU16_9HYPH|nr:prohibitin family protein [Enterovirga rhinocerotis]TDR89254.1 regulator of protease activity HflC (stomatin/prohibitin superfamily) [Enterovirga rhinocerotis]
MNRILSIVVATVVVLAGLSVLFGTWYTIDQGVRGVILRNGALIGVAQPGLGFKLPLIDTVQKISVQTHVENFDNMHTYSKDQQPALLKLSVNYRVSPDRVADLYSLYGSVEGALARMIRPYVNQQSKIVFGGYTAVSAIQDRGKLNAEVAQAIENSVKGPIEIESVQIESIDFSKAYEQSIEQRMLAEVEVQRLRQNADREKVQAEITVTQATARANAVRAQAQAEADAIRVKGEAEATAIRARGAALGDNPHLVNLVQAERWNGVLPTTMVPGGAVPMISMNR